MWGVALRGRKVCVDGSRISLEGEIVAFLGGSGWRREM